MIAINLLWVVLGAGILVVGGELLVRGAAAMARNLGISPMVVGLTVVALGTSAPELIVCVLASLKNQPDICAGNVVGSNILNVLLVLGVTAMICPLQASAAFVRREVPIALGSALVFWGLSYNGVLSRIDAAILVALLVGYMAMTVWIARKESTPVAEGYADLQTTGHKRGIALNLFFLIVGLALLGWGADLFLEGAVAIAKHLKISEAVIGLTLVAFGTSVPELAACLIAALRKHPDICLGNLVGSCIYNILAIIGVSGLVTPLPISGEMFRLHMPVMIGATILLLVFVATGLRVSRKEGAALLLCYAGYVGWSLWNHFAAVS
ncbi:MAG: calcium/sodium antiporter [Phycisphaerales bacterium]|nr:calcium/sodium antiporter [Phycisphaerales bacterium]MCB9856390.1 calcium/sodium antiporter [Phycisphaerales bacterium]MCB9864521.1 calcium/sodium antiporter [Phycisphaerales bacterium]